MEVLTTVLLWVLGVLFAILIAVISRALADECKTWMPWFTDRLVRRAICRMPAGLRERFEEEWHSHLRDIPGELGRLIFAVWLLPAPRRMKRILDEQTKKKTIDERSYWWFDPSEMYVRVDAVCEKLVGFPRDRAKHDAFMTEVRSLVDEVQTLAMAMNKACLAEKRRSIRKRFSTLNKHLVKIASDLDFAARHYTENLELHETIDRMIDNVLIRERLEKHDAECPFKSDKFRRVLAKQLSTIHREVEELRESLASTI